MSESTFQTVCELLAQHPWGQGLTTKASALKLGTRLQGDLGADSLDMVEIVMELEDEFDIAISDQVAERWSTIEDIVATVDREIAETAEI